MNVPHFDLHVDVLPVRIEGRRVAHVGGGNALDDARVLLWLIRAARERADVRPRMYPVRMLTLRCTPEQVDPIITVYDDVMDAMKVYDCTINWWEP